MQYGGDTRAERRARKTSGEVDAGSNALVDAVLVGLLVEVVGEIFVNRGEHLDEMRLVKVRTPSKGGRALLEAFKAAVVGHEAMEMYEEPKVVSELLQDDLLRVSHDDLHLDGPLMRGCLSEFVRAKI